MDNHFYWKLRALGSKVYYSLILPLELKERAKTIGKKDRIEVVFFAMNLAMWRYQGIYDLLSMDKRFNCHVVFTVAIDKKATWKSDLEQMRDYFGSQGIQYVDFDENKGVGYDVRGQINPDIVFYPQPYGNTYPAEHDFSVFKDKLMCYMPYSINVIKASDWLYDLPFHNFAWKIYRPLSHDKVIASKVARNKGRNVVTSGYLNLERYLSEEVVDVWKNVNNGCKRLIWAPHFTIETAESWLRGRGNFLWMSQMMLDIARQYKDRLQIAFKPHPRLKSELYRHPDWGKEKTDRYYQLWANMENTQLETGDFVDLFKTSDAMIHDCASFTAEYLYVNKPVAFTTRDENSILEGNSEFGRAALKQHYIVGNELEIRSFIENVVLGGEDSMAAGRTEFFETVLKPNVKVSTSQFIVNDIKKSLGIKSH